MARTSGRGDVSGGVAKQPRDVDVSEVLGDADGAPARGTVGGGAEPEKHLYGAAVLHGGGPYQRSDRYGAVAGEMGISHRDQIVWILTRADEPVRLRQITGGDG